VFDDVTSTFSNSNHIFYSSSNENPIKPSEITLETPLDHLYLSWTEKELPEHERTKHVHRLHPYLGKYVPQLVEIFLRKFFKPGETILDPFAGSGTTLVQANELGMHGIGYDVSAFNIILMRAKTAHYNVKEVEKEVKDILLKVEKVTQHPSAPIKTICSKRFLPGKLLSQGMIICNAGLPHRLCKNCLSFGL